MHWSIVIGQLALLGAGDEICTCCAETASPDRLHISHPFVSQSLEGRYIVDFSLVDWPTVDSTRIDRVLVGRSVVDRLLVDLYALPDKSFNGQSFRAFLVDRSSVNRYSSDNNR